MTDRPKKTLSAAGRALIAGGFTALLAGLAAWMWIGDWRLAATGLLVTAATIVVAAFV